MSFSYRSPSSPAARQLAAELDELRRIGGEIQQKHDISMNNGSLSRSLKSAKVPNCHFRENYGCYCGLLLFIYIYSRITISYYHTIFISNFLGCFNLNVAKKEIIIYCIDWHIG